MTKGKDRFHKAVVERSERRRRRPSRVDATHANRIRERTLLVEYEKSRRSNAFIDRRFGEGDERLTDQDRALMRFKAERMRESKSRGKRKFELADDDEDGLQNLTRLGRAIGHDGEGGWGKGRDNEEDEIGTAIMNAVQFQGMPMSPLAAHHFLKHLLTTASFQHRPRKRWSSITFEFNFFPYLCFWEARF